MSKIKYEADKLHSIQNKVCILTSNERAPSCAFTGSSFKSGKVGGIINESKDNVSGIMSFPYQYLIKDRGYHFAGEGRITEELKVIREHAKKIGEIQ